METAYDYFMKEITYAQYAQVMASRPSVKPYSEREFEKMGSQQKVLLALTFRRELAELAG